MYRLVTKYGIPYETLWLNDYTDSNGKVWTNDKLLLNSGNENSIELTALCYSEVPALDDDEYIAVKYTVEKNGDVWDRTIVP